MQLSNEDLDLLKLLEEDSRISARSISKKLNISTPTVISKIRALEELGVIRKYTIIVDSEKIREYKDIFLIEKTQDYDQFLENLKHNENVRKIYNVEENSIILLFVYNSIEESYTFLKDLDSRGAKYRHMTVLKEEKSENESLLKGGLSFKLFCYYCKKEINETPIEAKVYGKTKYFCCHTCKKEYLKKIERLESL